MAGPVEASRRSSVSKCPGTSAWRPRESSIGGQASGAGTAGMAGKARPGSSEWGSPAAPRAWKRVRPSTDPLTRSCEVERPAAATSTSIVTSSPIRAVETNWAVAQRTRRRVAASMAAMLRARPAPRRSGRRAWSGAWRSPHDRCGRLRPGPAPGTGDRPRASRRALSCASAAYAAWSAVVCRCASSAPATVRRYPSGSARPQARASLRPPTGRWPCPTTRRRRPG